VPAKQVERLTRQIGLERVAQRDAAVAAFEALPLARKFEAPPGAEPPDLAVVMVDGGRLQIRERGEAAAAGPPPGDAGGPGQAAQPEWDEEGAGKGFWREDKVGLLLTMRPEASEADPCPELPAGLIDVLRVPKLARELGKVAAGQEGGESDGQGSAAEQALGEAEYRPPEVASRKVVASCQPWRAFAAAVAQAAWASGFQAAARKAFVGDGSANNWRLQRRFFGSFVPVLDFIHALSYVYAGATAGRPFAEGWGGYQEWISRVWKGEVEEVIEGLRRRQEELGLPGEQDGETSPPRVVARALGYLQNNKDKMRYDEYRRQGLPITSSLMESVVKQVNRRVKGTEKFWCEQGGEAILQLRGDYLSDDQPLEVFWQQRQAAATGQRRYQRAAG